MICCWLIICCVRLYLVGKGCSFCIFSCRVNVCCCGVLVNGWFLVVCWCVVVFWFVGCGLVVIWMVVNGCSRVGCGNVNGVCWMFMLMKVRWWWVGNWIWRIGMCVSMCVLVSVWSWSCVVIMRKMMIVCLVLFCSFIGGLVCWVGWWCMVWSWSWFVVSVVFCGFWEFGYCVVWLSRCFIILDCWCWRMVVGIVVCGLIRMLVLVVWFGILVVVWWSRLSWVKWNVFFVLVLLVIV